MSSSPAGETATPAAGEQDMGMMEDAENVASESETKVPTTNSIETKKFSLPSEDPPSSPRAKGEEEEAKGTNQSSYNKTSDPDEEEVGGGGQVRDDTSKVPNNVNNNTDARGGQNEEGGGGVSGEREEVVVAVSSDSSSSEKRENVLNSTSDPEQEEEPMEVDSAPQAATKDVEKFEGKIVYNPDGSAYIIEENGDASASADGREARGGGEEEGEFPPRQEGSFVDRATAEAEADGEESPPPLPQIANAVYISRSAAYYGALYGKALREQRSKSDSEADAPVVHSYKVFSVRSPDGGCDSRPAEVEAEKRLSTMANTVPVKPILMCFICKLSFGFAKSFEGHCTGEHGLEMSGEERDMLAAKNSSAIIQVVGKDKRLLVSFLEPVAPASGRVEEAASSTREESSPRVSIPPPVVQERREENSILVEEKEEVANKDEDEDSSKPQEKEEEPKEPQVTLSPTAIKGILSAALTQNAASLAAAAAAAAAASSSASSTPSTSSPIDSLLPRSLPHPFPPLPPPPDFVTGGGVSPGLPPTSSVMDLFSLPLALRGGPQPPHLPPPPPPLRSGESSLAPPSPIPQGIPSNANMLQGTTIGACPDHVNGRQAGVDCAKCDLILNRLPGAMGWNTARNSCKTLKCPKCNWHYKYQETLEIHMKEKHPENETTCIYCITGQQHPRLARGETYTCGYKPYRCEVCNYSTTTKGNLSIHMQSDKHLNNMQELQNGGGLVHSPDGSRISQSPVGRGMPPSPLAKQKPNWRCDVCNYETNVARNLRIHMTSEKHTHNIMVLQQNVKHMQQMAQQAGVGGPKSPLGLPGFFPGLPGLDPQQQLPLPLGGLNFPGMDKPPQQPEAAMADLAYLQAVMMQMMTGGQIPGPMPPNFNPGEGGPGVMDISQLNPPDGMEPPPEPADPNPKFLFSCCVCKEFGSDSIEFLSQHLTQDRTKIREHEVSIVIAGNYICKLCSYKTNLKANFQLHCKTDKHLQRLNHVNHIKEGGLANEWKLKFLNVTNPVQLRCNACDYYTNSLHKLQLHIANQRHEISTILFAHLKRCEVGLTPDREHLYLCSLCKFSSPGKLLLMNHVRSMKHLQMEQIHQLQKRSEGNAEQTEIGDIFQVVEKGGQQQQQPAPAALSNDGESDSAGKQKKFLCRFFVNCLHAISFDFGKLKW